MNQIQDDCGLGYAVTSADYTDMALHQWMLAAFKRQPSEARSKTWTIESSEQLVRKAMPNAFTYSDPRVFSATTVTNDAAVCVTLYRGTSVTVRVSANTKAHVDELIAVWQNLLPVAEPGDDRVPVHFWYLTPNGPHSITKMVTVPHWVDVVNNYPSGVRQILGPLLTEWRPSDSGQLLLWHGLPGTGKTWAMRALAKEWQPWCSVDYITDVDNFFGNRVDYLMTVLLSDDDDTPATMPSRGVARGMSAKAKPEPKWRLLILEDAGELIVPDARTQVGQGLSRLLNTVDGLLGQGTRLLVLITTNEPLSKIHPAVARPGRCASAVEFKAFPLPEAAAWLGAAAEQRSDVWSGPQTLANLYARKRGLRPLSSWLLGLPNDRL